MRRNSALGIFIAAIALIAAAWVGMAVWSRPVRPASPADPTDVAQVAAGQAIYVTHCASCHGDKLQGQPNWKERKADGKLPAPPHDATGHTWHHPDQQIFQITKLGIAAIVPNYKSDMIGFGNRLSDRDIWNVIAYIKSTWPLDIQARQATVTQSAASQNTDVKGTNP